MAIAMLYKVMAKFLAKQLCNINITCRQQSQIEIVTLQSQMSFMSPLQWIQATSSNCRVVLNVCGFSEGPQDNWLITQHISRMVNGTALQQVTVQVDFIISTCDIGNNCRRSFAIHKYETSTINTTAARTLSNYEFVSRIVPKDGSGNVRENK